MDNIYFDSISYPMLIILFICIGLIIFLIIIEPRIFKKKLSHKNEHGSSKFADIKEIKDNFDKENINNINKAGFPVWYEKKDNKFDNIYFDNKSPHYLLLGSTGSGKSKTVSINMCLHFATAKEKHSVVVTDPKGELFMSTGQVFKDNGYKVVTVDFRNPTKSDKINIMQPIITEWKEHCYYDKAMIIYLSHFLKTNKISISKILNNKKYKEQLHSQYKLENYIIDIIISNREILEKNIRSKKFYQSDEIKKYCGENSTEYLNNKNNNEILKLIVENQNKSSKYQAETNRLVISLSNLIFADNDTKDKFWVNSSKQLFVGIVGIFLEDFKKGLIDENKINISSVKKFQNSSLIKENQLFLQKNLNDREYGTLSKDYLSSILSSAENTYKSITAVFGEKMSIFDDLNIENITSVSEFYFSDIGKQATVLYIIVPDEDRSYFQLVTIIIGMLIKDLTKLANLPENKGILPTKVEWILDEFANCPPLDSIETVVSVARSRGMRFYFFIQSFAQLNQVYGKEIANIIQDNAALCYLKTNSVDSADSVVKKLGRQTLITQSISKSTDPFKVGANQTESLMGRELLTVNEIINLKYKTIIFPTFGNPIFRDTYLYTDVYPEYKNCKILERKEKILKRLTDNYYTVEKMRDILSSKKSKLQKTITETIENSYTKNTNRRLKTIVNTINNEIKTNQNSLFHHLDNIKKVLKDKIISASLDEGIYRLEITSLLNKFEILKIKRLIESNIILEIGSNQKTKRTFLFFWFDNIEGEI